MIASSFGDHWPSVDEVVEAYESAQTRDGYADLRNFVPAADHPEYLAILCELVRVDLEYGWQRGRPSPLESYKEQFPDLFRNVERASAIEYEESRLRRQRGDGVAPDPSSKTPAAVSRLRTPPRPSSPQEGAADALVSAASVYRAYRRGSAHDLAHLDELFSSERTPRESADLFRSLHAADPCAADRLAQAIDEMPDPGSDFLSFRLEAELGRGAFGRVYLARQGDLANRPVALKVSADVTGEMRALAQLQHTNIVPIYSVHRAGALQAVCMPYLGPTTLADVLTDLRNEESLPDSGAGLLSSHRRRNRETGSPTSVSTQGIVGHPASDGSVTPSLAPNAGLTVQAQRLCGFGYVQAVLWLAARLADGLAHAHERGILHLDLKPANVLLSDDGEPLLLDFNLSADIKHPAHPSSALLGGTLPYMAPEHLEAFRDGSRTIDARSDVYAVGVILYELLTKQLPYEVRRGSVDDVIGQMIADRQGPPPDLRHWNRQVTPAVESIVRRCLATDPDQRYQSARELGEDLQRQLDDLPLKHAPEPSLRERLHKWARRHPRLTSTTTVAVLAACLVTAITVVFVARQRDLARLEAVDSFHRLTDEVAQTIVLLGARDAEPRQLEEGFALGSRVLKRYGVIDDPTWKARPLVKGLSARDGQRLRVEVGDLLLFLSRANTWKAEKAADPKQRATDLQLATRLTALADACFGKGEAPRALALQQSAIARLDGHEDRARKLREGAEHIPLQTPRDRFWFVTDRVGQGARREILPLVWETSRGDPGNYATYLFLGNCYVSLGLLDEAASCFGIGIALNPELTWSYWNRGFVYLDLKKYPEAIADFDAVIARRPKLPEAYINRALAKMGKKDFAGAVSDLGLALEQPDAPTRALFLRARASEGLNDREGAERDRAEGMKRTPRDELSWVARGLARLPKDPQGAMADFDAALVCNPQSRFALQNKAYLLSEHLRRTDDAVEVLGVALRHHPNAVESLAGRGVLLARLGRRTAALQDARAALDLSDRAETLYQVAGIFALTSRQEAGDRRDALQLMADALRKDPAWLQVVPRDHDLDPIRDDPGFRDLLRAVAVLLPDEAPGRAPFPAR